MFRIALIGANSFLGRSLTFFFHNCGYKVDLFSRSKSIGEHPSMIFAFPNSLPDFSVFLEYDIVIYSVAAGVQSSSKPDTDEFYQLNSFLPIQITKYLGSHNFKGTFFTFGSYFEIGENRVVKYLDEDEVALSNYRVNNDYCLSKRLLTRFVNSSTSDIRHFHLILPSIYGRNENLNRLIPYIVRNIKGNADFQLTSGIQIRQYLHVNDVAECIVLFSSKSLQSGIYNLSSNNHLQIRDLVDIIFRFFGKDPEVHLGKAQKRDESMPVLMLSNKKARSCGWNPKISLFEGISDVISSFE